ncbi:MAG: hypothetical protein Q9225_003714 [Loekoesia sp. 1 TL-2023]
MSLHRTHGDVEEFRISSALLNPDAQKAPQVEPLEYSSYENSLRSSSAVIARNDKRSTSQERLYVKLSACITALFVDWWAGELLANLLSIIAFFAIIIVVHKYDGHPLPRLPHDVTLNFVVSTLATITKSTLLLAVASALGQFKWLWMSSRPRRLQDLQVFDEASRGPLGAAKLLTSRTGFLPEINGQTLLTSDDSWLSGSVNNEVIWDSEPMGSFSVSFVEMGLQDETAFLVIPVDLKTPTQSKSVIPLDLDTITKSKFNFTDGTSVQASTLIALIRISTQATDLGAVLAAELCALSLCAQKRNVSVSSNQVSSSILQTVYGKIVDHRFNTSEAAEEVSSTWLSFSGDDFNMTFPSQVNESDWVDGSVINWISKLQDFRNSLIGNLTEFENDDGKTMFDATSNIIGAFNASSNISMAMDNIATALTNYFRDSSNVTVTGQAGQVESYVAVSWRWITLPAFLIVAGTMFLLLTIFKSKRRGARIWKTSELALLFHGFERPDKELDDLHRRSEMEDIASQIRVKIAKTSGGGWILRRQGACD